MAQPNRRQQVQPLVTARVLRRVAKAMLPFYRKIAGNRSFAGQWSAAVVKADLSLMGRLLSGIPTLAGLKNYGTNGIGYFISFPFPLPVAFYTNGTTIPPGSVQFTFNTTVHRAVARAVLPFYKKLAVSQSYAEDLAAAINRKQSKTVNGMVRRFIKTQTLKSVTIEEHGLALLFKTRFSKYPYRNLLFQENM
ncbi:hypothetical protein [Paenibacillus tianjinensis]|uniref:Uncharacterized protein n=1 Tax=Paenibacillus tianjinensis TaxID=2810347 RepID=A0ABX7LI50_9BACL|nr:hypothetical protein [Paenibacillus tianjinensis]QSF47141.1 hypothetical protein JRJ22_11535 [Paenibacillus tianjinensis]